jgi:hypothetical protein
VQITIDPKQLEIVLPIYFFVLLGPVYCSAFILLCLILHCTISSSEINVVASAAYLFAAYAAPNSNNRYMKFGMGRVYEHVYRYG